MKCYACIGIGKPFPVDVSRSVMKSGGRFITGGWSSKLLEVVDVHETKQGIQLQCVELEAPILKGVEVAR